MCIGPNQKNQPNLDLYLVRRYKICLFPIVVSYLCIGQNQKNQPNLVLYLVRRYKIFVSVATLLFSTFWKCYTLICTAEPKIWHIWERERQRAQKRPWEAWLELMVFTLILIDLCKKQCPLSTGEVSCVRGHPYITSALRGRGVSPKEDVVREVAWI